MKQPTCTKHQQEPKIIIMSDSTTESERLERSIEIDEKIDEIVNGVYPLLGKKGSTKYKLRVECRSQLTKELDELLKLANDNGKN